MTSSPVAVIVLNYNGRDLTLQALESVRRMRYPSYEIIVVDNGSSDGSAEAVRKAFPDVIVVHAEHNLAVSGGYNLGMRTAIERGAEFFLLLNNDIETDPGLLAELMAVAVRDPRIGAVGAKTYFHEDRQRIFSAGGILRFAHTITQERGQGELDRGQFDRDEERLYANGNGMLIRRTAVEAAGLWDPLFHLAVEDADWCTRIRERGFSVWYAHKAVLYHMVGASLGTYKASRTWCSGRANALFVRRHARPWQWLTFLAGHAVALPLAFLRELPRGNQGAALAKLKGVVAGLRTPLTRPPTLGDPIAYRERSI